MYIVVHNNSSYLSYAYPYSEFLDVKQVLSEIFKICLALHAAMALHTVIYVYQNC